MTAATALRRTAPFLAAFTLAGCIPATNTSAPFVSASIVTPAPPTYRYSWVMAHAHQAWGVQIGPKVDADGTHVAVYGWQNCAAAYEPCDWTWFHEYQTLPAGSVHDYAITRAAGGWALSFDGQVLATLNPGSEGAIPETGSEVTAS